jgi:hypothetical protein
LHCIASCTNAHPPLAAYHRQPSCSIILLHPHPHSKTFSAAKHTSLTKKLPHKNQCKKIGIVFGQKRAKKNYSPTKKVYIRREKKKKSLRCEIGGEKERKRGLKEPEANKGV